ncbi:MAG: SCO family protein, partial [Gemmatimonadetes bacterium]|nr:SCO family protein [Gemmatimonadota bacterium]
DLLFADPRPAPGLDLVDLDGDAVGLEALRGQVVALFFGYTQCPDVCPITLSQLSRLRAEIDPEGSRLQIVFVSLDPVRDTPEVLERYVASFGADVLAWTAPVDVLRPQVLEWGIGFVYRPRAGGPADSVAPDPAGALGEDYLVDHTARTFVIDGEGRLRAQLLHDTRSDALREVLATVLEEG